MKKVTKTIITMMITGMFFLIATTALFILRAFHDELPHIMHILPFALLGVGVGLFFGGLAMVTTLAIKHGDDFTFAKELDIESNDERNIAISRRAGAAVQHWMLWINFALLIFFAVMQVQLLVIMVFLGVHVFTMLLRLYYKVKFYKEM